MARVTLSNVSKSYGVVEVIDNLNLTVDDGAFTVFVGPSGCGKSTLLRMIAGLEPITKGDLVIDGKRVNDADPIERGVAMVFQNYALYPHMTVEQNIGFSLRMAGLSKSDIAARVDVAAQTLQIEPLLKRRPAQLSGGQRQRVAIGRAIVRDPEVFLFDEPLSNLDAELRVSMRVEIAKLHHKLGSTMIYVTHDQTEAMTLADKIVVMRDGKIEQAGTPDELYADPDNLFVAGFIGSPRMNFLRAALTQGGIKLAAGPTLTVSGLPASGEVLVGVRPEHFVLEGTDAGVPITVDVVENLGGTRYLYGSTASGENVVVEVRDRPGVKAGDVVPVGINPARHMVFRATGERLRPGH
jgi:lactose/L-arabinose transport system ATP-binding protein